LVPKLVNEHATTTPPSCFGSVGSMPSELEKLRSGFCRSWMNDSECIAFLDQERVSRQNALVLELDDAAPGTEGWRDDQGAFAFSDLVWVAKIGLAEPVAVMAVTLGCALIAELLATVFNENRRAGGVFHESQDERRSRMQNGMVTLRNAVCHPGYLAEPVNSSSNVDELALLLPDEQRALRDELLRNRRTINDPGLARWATRRVDSLGRFEAAGAIADRLERRRIEVSTQDRCEIDKRAEDTRLLPAMLAVLDGAKSVGQVIAAS
jgi:hypothetical protein